MNTLFPLAPVLPPGFLYEPDFLTEQEETKLLRIISGMELRPLNFHGYEAKRHVASFGTGWSFSEKALKKGAAIPEEFDPLLKKISGHLHTSKSDFAQLLITEYPIGSVINWHRDAPPYEFIIGISLGSDCIFRFRPYEKEKRTRGSLLSFPLLRRSLYVMKEASRRDWEHSTAPVTQIRHSITVRVLR
jgi:alkylated DNA repair dioxygenase AlkB